MKRLNFLFFPLGLLLFGSMPYAPLADGEPTKTTSVNLKGLARPKVAGRGERDKTVALPPVSAANAAGSTSGSLSVSPTGGAVYSIPIIAPPGIRDVVPNINLGYSSQSGLGLAGWGWNIGGLSSITRVGSTPYHDGLRTAVALDQGDRFALDGQRLMVTSGTYGAQGSIYGTETFSHVKIQAIGNAGGAPEHFVVHYPDGSRAWYGQSTASRSQLEWAIDKWQDPQGNTIIYNYLKSNGLLRIDTIEYGGNSTTSDPNSNQIRFQYGDRSRTEVSYIGGTQLKRTKILKSIASYSGATLIRNYTITHLNTSLGYETIDRIQETNSSGSSLPPITFTYGTSQDYGIQQVTDISTNSTEDPISQETDNMLAGDFNGDGHMDILTYKRNVRKKVKVFANLHTGNPFNSSFEVETTGFQTLLTGSVLGSDDKLLPGQAFVSVRESHNNNELKSRVTFSAYRINGSIKEYLYGKSWDAPTYKDDGSCNAKARYALPKKYVSGDFNGDGLMDVMAISYPFTETFCNPVSCDGGGGGNPQQKGTASTSKGDLDCCDCTDYVRDYSRTYFLDLDRRKTIDGQHSSGIMAQKIKPSDLVQGIDINGDGKSDLVHISQGRIMAYTLNELNNLVKILDYSDSDIVMTKPLLFGDYNGDGKIDLLTPLQGWASTQWKFLFNTGNEMIPREQTMPFKYYFNQSGKNALQQYHYSAQDYDGNGVTDIIMHTDTGNFSPQKYTIELYTNDGFNGTSYAFSKKATYSKASTGSLKIGIPVFIDTKPGNPNLEYAYIYGKNISSYELTMDHRREVELRQITNDGLQNSISYHPLSDGTLHHRDDHSLTYPLVNINHAPGMRLVTRIVEQGSGMSRTMDFRYKGAASHATGLGFLGFVKTWRTNWYGNGVTQLYSATEREIEKRGVVKRQWVANHLSDTPSNYISLTTHTNTATVTGEMIFRNLVDRTVSHDDLQDIQSTTDLEYDGFFNLRKTTTSVPDKTMTEEYTYFNNPGSLDANYHMGRPKTVKVVSTLDGHSFTDHTEYLYTDNQVRELKKKGEGTHWVSEHFSYDAYGNVTTSTVSVPDTKIKDRTESFDYSSSNGRYLNEHTSVLGLKTTYEYYPHNGKLKKVTDPYSNTTQYTYNAWDRTTSMTDYLGLVTLYTYHRLSDGGIKVTMDTPQGKDTETHTNAFGWETYSHALDLNGKKIAVSKQYDVSGRNIKTSAPYFSSAAPSQWNQTIFDEYGRTIEQRLYTGKVIATSYNGLSVTASDGTKSTTTTKDTAGNIVSLTDPGGTIQYTYFGNGSLRYVDYGGQRISNTIDGWGRKTQMTDPSAGTYTYSFNQLGELIEQTSPKGKTVLKIDDFGRVIKKTLQGDHVHLEQDFIFDSLGQLDFSTATDQLSGRVHTYDHTYDSYQRPEAISEIFDGLSFSKTNHYDSYGRIHRQTYETTGFDGVSSMVSLRNSFDGAGILNGIKDDTTQNPLWQLTSRNHRGQATAMALGNGYTHKRTYDTFGMLEQIRDSHIENDTHALRMDYDFDAGLGILKGRDNLDLGWAETFAHDDQNRLTEINGSIQRHQSYNANGTIKTNDILGAYNYDTTKKYRLASMDLYQSGQDHYGDHPVQRVTYNAFKKPVKIHVEGKARTDFAYGPNMARIYAWYGGQAEDKEERTYKKAYSSILPIEVERNNTTGEVRILTFVGGDGYTAPVVHLKTKTGGQNGFHYLHRDYLGSILAITDTSGNVLERRQFGAWGTVDQFADSAQNTTFNQGSLISRGFTGHEHFFDIGLIHMNGRMYDAVLGRFLSPDNFVQDPYNTQNFNRYGYVLNNPLINGDPSGEFILTAAIIGAAIGGVSAALKKGSNFGTILGGTLIGAAAGAIGAGVANAAIGGSFLSGQALSAVGFTQGFTSGFAGGLAGGFVGGAGNAWLYGANFWEGVRSGVQAGYIGGFSGGLIGGIVGGIRATSNNREFWSGQKWLEAKTALGSDVGNQTLLNIEEPLVDWDIDYEMDITRISQREEFDCAIACKKMSDRYFQKTNQSEINGNWFETAKSQGGLTNTDIFRMYRNGSYTANLYNGNFSDQNILQWMVGEMRANRIVQVSAQPIGRTSATFHAVIIKRIRYLEDFSRFRINYIDPSSIGVRINNFRTYNQLFSIWPR